jgi:poly(3-hydroxybutyrate) depolymerase
MIRLANALWLSLMLLCASASAAERLRSYPVDPAQVSVSGLSSGAFMANQLHIAHSADIMGAALIAGGLYGCAVLHSTDDGVEALASQAGGPCMSTPFLLEDVAFYADLVRTLAGKAEIDSPSNLAHSRIYIFSGGSDSVVSSQTVEKGRDLYASLGVPTANIVFEDHSGPAAKAGHSWVTKSFGGKCSANKEPYINDCAYDQAGAELKAIYGPDLKPPAAAASGRIVAFDQTEFVAGRAARANGLSDAGFLYVPNDCEPGAQALCRLHIVLHGCQQSSDLLGAEFYTRIGVNEWADSNRIIVLYPQAHATTVAELPATAGLTALIDANPYGCWNWWGYAEDPRYLTKNGVQIGAIWSMVRRIEARKGRGGADPQRPRPRALDKRPRWKRDNSFSKTGIRATWFSADPAKSTSVGRRRERGQGLRTI